MEKMRIDLGKDSYDIYFGSNILSRLGETLSGYPVNKQVLVVTNPTVKHYYGETVLNSLKEAGFSVRMLEVPDGEEYKSLKTAESIYQAALQENLNRKSTIVALGGGVIGDLTGFVAATYMRGTNFVQVPTTLLAQVDSSVGGKVAVNLPQGKNLVGCFYQPKFVFTDISTLNTLPEIELKAGLAEVIKYGVIWSEEFFQYLEENLSYIKSLEPEIIKYIVGKSCYIKGQVVEKDEKEENLRAILNYGHTVGHAVESLTDYQRYKHGEAVALGMISAANLSLAMGIINSKDSQRIKKLIEDVGLPTFLPSLNLDQILDSLAHDKKVITNKVRFILPTHIGQVIISDQIDLSMLREVLKNQMGGD